MLCFFYNRNPIEIVFKAEDQSPFLDVLKTNSDVFGAGNMSAKRFVKDTYRHLSQEEQDEEIKTLEETKKLSQEMKQAVMNSQQGFNYSQNNYKNNRQKRKKDI